MTVTSVMITITSRMPTAAAVENVHAEFLSAILPIAKAAMTGARINACRPSTIRSWICVTSLVERVMRLAVEKRPISSIEKACTRSNRRRRSAAPKFDAMREAAKATTTLASRLPNAQSSIFPPERRTAEIALSPV